MFSQCHKLLFYMNIRYLNEIKYRISHIFLLQALQIIMIIFKYLQFQISIFFMIIYFSFNFGIDKTNF